jgi:hypothetical protein
MGGVCRTHVRREMKYKVLRANHERKRPLATTRSRREDIIMAIKEVGWEDVEWIHLARIVASGASAEYKLCSSLRARR